MRSIQELFQIEIITKSVAKEYCPAIAVASK